MVMQSSTGQTLTQRLQATHSSSFTSKTRPGSIAIAWWLVSSQAAKQRPQWMHSSWSIFAFAT